MRKRLRKRTRTRTRRFPPGAGTRGPEMKGRDSTRVLVDYLSTRPVSRRRNEGRLRQIVPRGLGSLREDRSKESGARRHRSQQARLHLRRARSSDWTRSRLHESRQWTPNERKARDSDSVGLKPSRGGFGGTTFVPPGSPLAGGH